MRDQFTCEDGHGLNVIVNNRSPSETTYIVMRQSSPSSSSFLLGTCPRTIRAANTIMACYDYRLNNRITVVVLPCKCQERQCECPRLLLHSPNNCTNAVKCFKEDKERRHFHICTDVSRIVQPAARVPQHQSRLVAYLPSAFL